MATPIQKFYQNKTIFLTGASGFVGKVLIEKLLRTTDVRRIYALIRAKRDQTGMDRVKSWKKDAMFAPLLENNPTALDRIEVINGDCQMPDLGISESDKELLKREVQLVFYCAATVRFTENLHSALDINTRAIRYVMQMAKHMEHLEAFLHVSTAYSNCVVSHIEERFYPEHLTCSADKVLSLRENLSNELIDSMTSSLLGRYPNTYTYTKALAEQIVESEADNLPIGVFRPGVIIGGYKEPVVGWIDNLYGPISMIYGASMGVIRVTILNTKTVANLVTVDYCVNMMLACAWRIAKDHTVRDKTKRTPIVYNFAPKEHNVLSWGSCISTSLECGIESPLQQMKWFPFLHATTSIWLFKFIAFFYHTIPGFLMDLMLRLQGKEPIMVNLYRKIHKNIEVLIPFVNTNWRIDSNNADSLWNSLSKEDRRLYVFDMHSFDWNDYIQKCIYGIRLYIGKEDPSPQSIARGKQIRARFHKLHLLVIFLLTVSFLFLIKCLFI